MQPIFLSAFRITALSSIILLPGLPLAAQSTYTNYSFTTLAGLARNHGTTNGTGAAARFNSPDGIAVDGSGNLYVTDGNNPMVRKVSPGGVVTALAGMATSGSSDGTGTAAGFSSPVGVAVDPSGNVYVADAGNQTIRMVTPGGAVTTLAGTAGSTGSTDATGSAARFDNPIGLALDRSGNLYVADSGNDTIRKVTPTSVNGVVTWAVSTLAGRAGNPGSGDGTGPGASFTTPVGVAVDAAGNVYVTDFQEAIIRKITPGAVVTTVAGTAGAYGSADGTGAAAKFQKPFGIAVDANDNLYVTENLNNTIRKITPGAVVTTLGGVTMTTGSSDGLGAAALFNNPLGIAVDGNGYVYVGDTGNGTIRVGQPPAIAPVLTIQPVSVNIASGHSAVFSVGATGIPAPTYQWSLNNAPIAGATDPILQVPNAGSGTAGAYTCAVTNSAGSLTSNSATLTVTTTSNAGHLINLSARAAVGTGNNILIGGFGVGGAGTKQLLVRGVGPALSAFFNTDLVTPQLVLLDNGGAIVATNIGWGNAPVPGASTASESPVDATTNLMNSLGAYTINPGSADTAMVLTMPAGNNTAQISGVGGTSGIALCEIYDADTATPPSARLINISARADVLTGNSILIGGFVISGATAETVLIRAVGPGLNDELPGLFPLSSVLNQPVLTILDHTGAVIYSNTVWGGDATIAATFATTGAFPLNAGHADSVVLASLPPGGYTAQVSGLNSGVGIALCEIYEVY